MQAHPLVPHPSTPASSVRSLRARIDSLRAGRLAFYYELEGNLDDFEWPAPQRPTQQDGLWQHSCFEAFVRVAGEPGYFELNFSPSSEWAAYRFERYRAGKTALALDPAPRIVCRRRGDRLEADVDVSLAALVPEGLPEGELRVGLAVVLEDANGQLSYFALAHPPGKPDFHHDQGFVFPVSREAAAP